MGTLATYKPLYVWCSPASIPQIVAHIQDYLVKNPIVSTETVAEIVVQSLQEHPELINGAVIPITEDSAQTIKEYIDALPSLDGYTKAETDALLLLKQNLLTWDQTPTVGSSNPVTSEGIKAAISASAAALADLISTKADIASVYTKATTDALLLQKADAATTYSKNAVDALLDTKVDINDTYTRADIDLMKQVDKANTAIVTDGTAPFNIAAGQYLYVNDILYMATEPIQEGDPLVPGTNIALNPKGVTNVIGDGLQNLAHTVGQQSDQIGDVGKAIAKVENGATATQTINPGDYVYRNGTLYKYGGSTISTGVTIPTFSESWIVPSGGLNEIIELLSVNQYLSVTPRSNVCEIIRGGYYIIGKTAFLNLTIKSLLTSSNLPPIADVPSGNYAKIPVVLTCIEHDNANPYNSTTATPHGACLDGGKITCNVTSGKYYTFSGNWTIN